MATVPAVTPSLPKSILKTKSSNNVNKGSKELTFYLTIFDMYTFCTNLIKFA